MFAGAGASLSMPAGLPVFDWLRDEILRQLRLDRSRAARADRLAEVAAGLVPEPFMLELSRAGVDAPAWLGKVLAAGRPNAAHNVLAQLAMAGARVWTVNFDTLIEQAAGGSLGCIAWPQVPAAGAHLLKPHGSAGGELIVTAEQVLAGLDPRWLDRLRADVAGRTVVFLGYSGRDLDFQPIWNSVLGDADRVVWFERWADDREEDTGFGPVDERRKRLLARSADERGALVFPPPAPFPPGAAETAKPNPSWDFVAWCQASQLADVPAPLVNQLFDVVPAPVYPLLPGSTDWAKPAVQGLLGDYRGARRTYFLLAMRPGRQRRAAASLAALFANQGGTGAARMLRIAEVLPRRGRFGTLAEAARRKRITALHRLGRHDAVLRVTSSLPATAVSTYWVLRAAALIHNGNLDAAADTADAARQQALREGHPVRAAHAAFQQCLALMWAERSEEARRCLADYLEPYAAIAASRWVAWAGFIAGGLAVRDRNAAEAEARFASARTRFQAEALLDGIVSVDIAQLAAIRLRDDHGRYLRKLDDVARLTRRGKRGMRYYTRRHDFTTGLTDLDHAEFARVHQHDLDLSHLLYSRVSTAPFPLQAALGRLGLALIAAQRGDPGPLAADAATAAAASGCRLAAERGRELLAQPPHADPAGEVFFC